MEKTLSNLTENHDKIKKDNETNKKIILAEKQTNEQQRIIIDEFRLKVSQITTKYETLQKTMASEKVRSRVEVQELQDKAIQLANELNQLKTMDKQKLNESIQEYDTMKQKFEKQFVTLQKENNSILEKSARYINEISLLKSSLEGSITSITDLTAKNHKLKQQLKQALK